MTKDKMLDNCPFRSHQHKDLTIEGYSRAAVQSYWRVPELKLGFDLGAQPWDFMGTPTWCISHTHLDHIAALPIYVARRRMMKMEAPTIYLPEHARELTEHLLRVCQRLDRGRQTCRLVGVEPGDGIELSREHVLEVIATRHTVPSVGYIVWERRKKLKAEYQGLSGERIRDIRLSGVEVTEERRLPLLAYTGDTAPQGLDDNPALFEAKILITEMSFVAPGHRKEKIHKHGHLHLDDFVERRDRFKNEIVVVGHFSTRYHDKQILHYVRRALPDMLGGRLHLWL
jgi:ribonuclease Z